MNVSDLARTKEMDSQSAINQTIMVAEWANAIGWPTFTAQSRNVMEEIAELEAELAKEEVDKEHLLKEITDVLYTTLTFNIMAQDLLFEAMQKGGFTPSQMDTAFFLVHQNNMSKIKDGVIRNEHGKVMKPADYKPVNLSHLIKE